MPRNRFSLTVGVGSEIYLFAFFRKSLELLDKLFLALDNRIFRRKIIFDIYAQLCGGQIPDMPH